jgi:mannose-6-phosphate isomerase-like protein (cupin superfamily)
MWHYRSEETIHFLDGSVILDDGDGPRHYGPGDVIFIPAGAAVHWTVETHVRKLAFFHSQLPRPLARAVAMLRSAKRFLKRAQRRQIKVLGADAALASMG